MASTMVVLYVADQTRAAAFYREVLESDPVVDVPGMTEFLLPGGSVLGLMPIEGVRRLLPRLPAAGALRGGPCAEIYLAVEDPEASYRKAVAAGATALDPASSRDWGDDVAYVLDPDGHVVAFAVATAAS